MTNIQDIKCTIIYDASKSLDGLWKDTENQFLVRLFDATFSNYRGFNNQLWRGRLRFKVKGVLLKGNANYSSMLDPVFPKKNRSSLTIIHLELLSEDSVIIEGIMFNDT
jgi:hypothetical protein